VNSTPINTRALAVLPRVGPVLFLFLSCLPLGQPQAALPDYADFDSLLQAHVHDGQVSYAGFAGSAEFAAFIDSIGDTKLDASVTDAEKLAFYINAYNALAIQGINDGLSTGSAFARWRFFKRAKYLVAGDSISLEELEHQRIRKMGGARIHFAIVCASQSCPWLSSRAYLATTLNEQLDFATRRFINDPMKNRFDLAQKTATVSPIFNWFAEDFVAADGSVSEFLARYVSDRISADALLRGSLVIEYHPYDWSLNGALSAK
jgi:hypothetical protein